MRIVQIAAEFAPIAKAGGLGEVVLGLSRELTAQHHQVEVILPKYSFIPQKSLPQLKIESADLRTLSASNTIWSSVVEGCELRLIEARHPSGYFNRDKIYGYEDDVPRFLYFCRAALEYLSLKKEPIDILHLHDWHASICAPLLRELFASLPVKGILLTIHNLEYQGRCATWDLDAIGMKGASYLTPQKLQDPHYPQSINLLKGGIVYANAVNTVSPTHAKEILTPEMGFGLDPVLRKKQPFGILNGIDATIWNPATDPALAPCYGPDDSLSRIMESKRKNRLPLRLSKKPLVGAITRLVPQKGTDLLQMAIDPILKAGGAFALLGSSPMPEIQKQFDALKERYQNNPDVTLLYEYNEDLAHRLYAACDFLLVPSLFEPCGLTQLVALRYGTIPIVRSTGGLKDTVFDCEDFTVPLQKRNGFVFLDPTPASLISTLERAFAFFKTDPATFQAMLQRAMRRDSSWHQPGKEYVKLYTKILQAGLKPAAVA